MKRKIDHNFVFGWLKLSAGMYALLGLGIWWFDDEVSSVMALGGFVAAMVVSIWAFYSIEISDANDKVRLHNYNKALDSHNMSIVHERINEEW